MTNNDVLRRLRYCFDFKDPSMISIFEDGGLKVTREQVSNWMKKEEDPDYRSCQDIQLASFLNGFIALRRGKRDGEAPVAEEELTNNIILRKITIALNLKGEDTIELLKSVDFKLSKPELSAFFRKSGHKHYRVCKDQVLRNFLAAVQINYHQDNA